MIVPINQNLQTSTVTDVHDTFLPRREVPLQDCIFSSGEADEVSCLQRIRTFFSELWDSLLRCLGIRSSPSEVSQTLVQESAALSPQVRAQGPLENVVEFDSCDDEFERIINSTLKPLFQKAGDPNWEESWAEFETKVNVYIYERVPNTKIRITWSEEVSGKVRVSFAVRISNDNPDNAFRSVLRNWIISVKEVYADDGNVSSFQITFERKNILQTAPVITAHEDYEATENTPLLSYMAQDRGDRIRLYEDLENFLVIGADPECGEYFREFQNEFLTTEFDKIAPTSHFTLFNEQQKESGVLAKYKVHVAFTRRIGKPFLGFDRSKFWNITHITRAEDLAEVDISLALENRFK